MPVDVDEEEWTKFLCFPSDDEECKDAKSTPPPTPLVPKSKCTSFPSKDVLREFISRLPQAVLKPYPSAKLSARTCINCQTNSTPFWRKAPAREGYYCNACGLYFRTHNCDRPTQLTTKQAERPFAKYNNQCAICGAVKTPLWRRSKSGRIICNACGLRSRLCIR